MSNINDKFGENMFGGRMRIQTEVVNGVCPTCHQKGVLVSLFKSHYRCVTCGSDLEQKVNGVISYIPMGKSNTKMVLEKDNG
tara:strand:- start:401 stop:646 length:246 start_codon:yes stop_codon:yes gene_type:complete